jgi:hypothetical protein
MSNLKNNPDLTSNGYTAWKCACYIETLENGDVDEFE